GKKGGLREQTWRESEAWATNFVEAGQWGEDDAFGRVIDFFKKKRQLRWDLPPLPERIARLRNFVRERLGAPSESKNESGALAIADAQRLVARAHGFESWAQLAKHIQG